MKLPVVVATVSGLALSLSGASFFPAPFLRDATATIRNSVAAAGWATPGRLAQQRNTDAVLQALDAEASRAMTGFKDKAERPPYYIGFTVWDRTAEVLTAGYGSILVDRNERQRVLDVDVRIGGYDFDNTRRLQGPAGGAGPTSIAPLAIPTGDDVDALRAAIWLRTEREYRSAAERILQVEGNRATTAAAPDTSGDFSRESAHTLIEDLPPAVPLDRNTWTTRLKRLSARFDAHPAIDRSALILRTNREVRYLVTTEGSRVRTGRTEAVLSVTVNSIAPDGTPLSLTRLFEASTVAKLPPEAALTAAVDTLIAEMMALRQAPEVEPFTGPAILSGRASAVFFHEIFGHRIEGHRQKDPNFAQTFTNRVGEEVLPGFLSVTDDPTRHDFSGTELSGHYRVDDEGVPSRSTKLIENGILSGFLMSRVPIQGALQSTGHGRRQPGFRAVARQGNLFVNSAKTVSTAQLRAMLIEEIKRQGKPYGLYLDEIQGGFTYTGRLTPQSFKVLPVKVFRVYADGRPDELVRGVDMVGTPLTVFAKILATDDRPQVFNGMCGAESGSIPVSAVSPAILIQEIEVEKKAKTTEALPILPPPPPDVRPVGGRGGAQGGAQSDVILQALNDELRRSMDSLRADGLPPVHFLAYRLDDEVSFSAEAFMGDMVSQSMLRTRRLEADLRVGNAEMDNTNFVGGGGGIGWVEIGFEDNYSAMRRFAWRITESKYRPAAQQLSQKEAALRGRPAPETKSFAPDTVRTMIEAPIPLTVDAAQWTQLLRSVSAVFREYPAIENSRIRVQVKHRNRYLLTSEGTRARTPESTYMITMLGITRGPGGPIREDRVFVVPAPTPLAADAMIAAARELAVELTARSKASTLEGYTGPVLFEGRAAPQMIQALFGRYLAGTAIPVAPAQTAAAAAALRRLDPLFGQRVLGTGLRVFDDPTLERYGGVPLMGRYPLDDEGAIPRRVDLVDDGVLKGFLMSRIPGRTNDRSTGHARTTAFGAPAPMIGNLIVESTTPMTSEQLRAELLRLARAEGHEFGLVIRSIEDGGTLPARPGAPRPRSELPSPVAVYRIFGDGREEPVRDVEFAEVTMRAVRDIVAAGDRPTVYNFLTASGSVPLGLGDVPVSVASPALLVREIQLQKSESTETAPLLGHPLFTGRGGLEQR